MANDFSALAFLFEAALAPRPAGDDRPPASFIVAAGDGGDPLAAAARVAGLLADFRPTVRLLSPLSTDIAVVTLHNRVFSGDVAAAFDLAEELSRAPGVAIIEPDLPYVPEQEGRKGVASVEREGASALSGCWVGEDPTLAGKSKWAPEMIRAPQAWKHSQGLGRPARGLGVVIAHLDTGLTSHPELAGAKILPGADLIDGDGAPTDPLDYNGNPGHGTSTASTIISPPQGNVLGSAPAASLLPIRCISSVIIILASQVAEAIDLAVDRGAHVITMSLGGLSSFALERALARAVAADVIVLAAAGNCVGFVVYPAADPNCLAIGGINAQSKPWQGSCRGPEVDICAPAENVFRAKAEPNGGGGSGQGEGTSYAVALTAGAAACWLAHHGRARAIAAARRKGLSLQELFRLALRRTARRPADWDALQYGAGVIDMEALLRLELSAITTREAGAGVASTTNPASRAKNLLLSLARNPSDALAAAPIHAVRTELIAQVMLRDKLGPMPAASRRLTAAIGDEGLAALGLAASADGGPETPWVMASAASMNQQADAQVLSIRKRLAAKQPGLESLSRESVPDDAPLPLFEDALKDFDPANADAFVARFPSGEIANPEEMKQALTAIWRTAKTGYRKLDDPRLATSVTPGEKAALEAVVNFDGSSPSLLLRQNQVDVAHPLIGAWKDSLFLANGNLFNVVAPAVGRIQRRSGGPGSFFGTGTHVAGAKAGDPPLVLTNFHVLKHILQSDGVLSRRNGQRIALFGGPGIDFNGEIDSPISVTHKIVAARLPEGVGETATALDAVALEIEPLSPARPDLPDPVTLAADLALAQGAAGKLVVIGFPAEPARTSGVVDGVDWNWITSVLFGQRFGLKRVAPGVVKDPVGGLGQRWHASVFTHDASTLGGSSGSLVFGLATGTVGLGLHFAGLTGERNEAHAFGLVAEALTKIGVKVV